MTRYTLEDLSLSEDFSGDIVCHHVLSESAKRIRLDQFEYHCGLERGELDNVLETAQNTVHGQADLIRLIASNSIVISPTLPVLDAVGDMINTNVRCDIDDRQCYDEIFLEPSYDYIIVPLSYDGPIFVRHPESHAITRFDTSSYDQLPVVTLSLIPCFPTIQSWNFIRCAASRCPSLLRRKYLVICVAFMLPLSFYYYNVPPSEFPDRKITQHPDAILRYERLHFPPLASLTTDSSSPLGKRSRSESDSGGGEEYIGAYVAPECVQNWVTESADTGLDNEWEDDDLGDEPDDEPVRSVTAINQGDSWVEVIKRRRSPPSVT